MTDIFALFQCLHPHMTPTTLRQFSRIVSAMLMMTGRVTMLGISRWAGKGGSYRTVQRLFAQALPWAMLFWVFFRQHVYRPGEVYLLAGDEVVVTKAGKNTYGLDRFFASLYSKVVPGLAFFALSLVSVQERRSFPIRVEQIVRCAAENAARKAKAAAKKQPPSTTRRRPGRPKGSQTQAKAAATLTPELVRIRSMLDALLPLITPSIPLTYLLLDGHFGNHNALHMAQQCRVQLISKLRSDAALYVPYEGSYAGRGPRRKYGSKLDYRNIPAMYLKATTVEGPIQTRLYQAHLLHKEFAHALNVVIIVKTNLHTHARAHVVLFSSDLELPYNQLKDYYCLRFQIEFNFRDAKQYWGLEDFMNVTETAVTNAVHLSLFMVNVSYRFLREVRQSDPACSLLDLKAWFRADKYVTETIKMLPEKPAPVLLAQIFTKLAGIGRIHAVPLSVSPR
jgi:putative transposase